MISMKNSYIKATKEGRLYIEIEDLLKSDKVRKTIAELMDSDIIKDLDEEEKLKLEFGKDYIHNDGDLIVIGRVGALHNSGFYNGAYYNKELTCNNHKLWCEATKEEVKQFFERHLIKRYGEDWKSVKIKECMHYGIDSGTNTGIYKLFIKKFSHGWEVWNINGCLFNGKEWAEVLEENKTATDLSEIDRPYYIDSFGAAGKTDEFKMITKNHMTSKELCEGILALQQLIAFRDNFYEVHGGVYEDSRSTIKLDGGVFRIYITRHETSVFDFAEHEQAREFLETHRELFNELKKIY